MRREKLCLELTQAPFCLTYSSELGFLGFDVAVASFSERDIAEFDAYTHVANALEWLYDNVDTQYVMYSNCISMAATYG